MDNDLDRLIARAWQERMTRRRFLRLSGLGMGAVALGPILAACGQGGGGGPATAGPTVAELVAPEQNVEFDFWHPFTGPDGPFMNDLVAQFNDETPTVQVNVMPQPGGGDYYNLIRTAHQTNESPPLVAIHHLDALPGSALDGVISPVDDLVSLLGLQETDFTPEVWNGTVVAGSRVGIPLDIHPLTFYYNRTHFEDAGLDPESPPADGDAFIEAAQALTTGDRWGFMFPENHTFLTGNNWASLFYQGGGQWANEDLTEATFNDEAGVQAAEWLKALITEHEVAPGGVAGDEEIAAFKSGTASMVWSGPWEITGYREALGEDVVGFGPLPQVFGQGVWAGSHNFAVLALEDTTAEQRQGAYYFINWLSEHSVQWAGAGQVPARASQRQGAEFEEADFAAAIAPQVEHARFFPAVPDAGGVFLYDGETGSAGLGVGRFLAGEVEDAQAALDEQAEIVTNKLGQIHEDYPDLGGGAE